MKLGKEILIDALKIWKTPPGEAIWPKVIDPETKFDAAGVYETRMKFTPEREEEFLPQLEEWYEAGYQQVCQEKHKTQLPREKPPWKKDKDGRVIVKFKLAASGVFDGKPWENDPPKLFDASGKPIKNPDPNKLRIGNASIVRVYFQVRPYFVQNAGITLRLKGVQIIKL